MNDEEEDIQIIIKILTQINPKLNILLYLKPKLLASILYYLYIDTQDIIYNTSLQYLLKGYIKDNIEQIKHNINFLLYNNEYHENINYSILEILENSENILNGESKYTYTIYDNSIFLLLLINEENWKYLCIRPLLYILYFYINISNIEKLNNLILIIQNDILFIN